MEPTPTRRAATHAADASARPDAPLAPRSTESPRTQGQRREDGHTYADAHHEERPHPQGRAGHRGGPEAGEPGGPPVGEWQPATSDALDDGRPRQGAEERVAQAAVAATAWGRRAGAAAARALRTTFRAAVRPEVIRVAAAAVIGGTLAVGGALAGDSVVATAVATTLGVAVMVGYAVTAAAAVAVVSAAAHRVVAGVLRPVHQATSTLVAVCLAMGVAAGGAALVRGAEAPLLAAATVAPATTAALASGAVLGAAAAVASTTPKFRAAVKGRGCRRCRTAAASRLRRVGAAPRSEHPAERGSLSEAR